ncbi:KICSTOR complex protein ITFG2 isoform X2 [Lingula anatina]|uniref:KICSTOR complex protein ITFG2 isoform X2 n=1 Tax=Lingula anatina TaxID=7574 RepID=A0A2R2MNZ0_LINAN|nr:KICSTOR complex protein ITFG2 isoform X2 [Lingula anatina]|eukprot:XP_023931939.1 KICSTOR complex protein ITFG2 isoform X2 [Lingula anatina]
MNTLNELVVGNIDGELSVFKGGDLQKPWARASDLGTITCVGVGDVCNTGRNLLVSHSSAGGFYLFDFRKDKKSQESPVLDSSHNSSGDATDAEMKPCHKQNLPANSKVMIIADVDGDNHVELVIGYSDRMVRTFRWVGSRDLLDPSSDLAGKFEMVDKWQLAAQIGAITLHTNTEGKTCLMVAQPGGTYVTLYSSDGGSLTQTDNTSESDRSVSPTLTFHPLSSARARNPGVTTEIVGDIQKPGGVEDKGTFYALCTLDGTLMLVEDDKILWSFQVDHQLFGLTKLDFTGDGSDEVIVCSWDGQTYIVNNSNQVVRFQFEEDVAAFCAGFYSVNGTNVPCLIYVTFNNKIYVYYNIRMPQIQSTNLLETMQTMPETNDLLSYFNIDASDPSQLKNLYHWCLYGKHDKPV